LKLTVSKARREKMFDEIIDDDESISKLELVRKLCMYKRPQVVISNIRKQYKPYIEMLETGEISDQDAIDVGNVFGNLDMFDPKTITPKFVAWQFLTDIDAKYSSYELPDNVEFCVQVVTHMVEFNKAKGSYRMGYVHDQFLMTKLIPSIMGDFKDPRVDDLVETYKLVNI